VFVAEKAAQAEDIAEAGGAGALTAAPVACWWPSVPMMRQNCGRSFRYQRFVSRNGWPTQRYFSVINVASTLSPAGMNGAPVCTVLPSRS
jgi:hypothetical protein